MRTIFFKVVCGVCVGACLMVTGVAQRSGLPQLPVPAQTQVLPQAQTVTTNSVAALPSPPSQEEIARRTAELEDLKARIPEVGSFTQWQRNTGELPPDFQRQIPTAFIPDPLRDSDISSTLSADVLSKRWNERRDSILSYYTRWVLGSSPVAPKEIIPVVAPGRAEYLQCFAQRATLKVGREVRTEIGIEMLFPRGTTVSSFPTLVLPAAKRDWAQVAVGRGFVVCLYAPGVGLDGNSLPESGEGTLAELALAKWRSAEWRGVCREAWTIRRVVDYLAMLPVVDKSRIILGGEGFHAKAVIIAAAADTRVAATLAFSPGLGGFTPFRTLSEVQMGVGIEGLTRMYPEWFHPRLRFYAGRENYLPFEQTDLVACIAPRSLYVATLMNDPSESLWGNELAMNVLKKTYLRLGATPQNVYLRAVDASAFSREDIESAIDWLEFRAGWRMDYRVQEGFYPTYEQWAASIGTRDKVSPLTYPEKTLEDVLSFGSGNPVLNSDDWATKRAELHKQVNWALGDMPPFLPGESEFVPEATAKAIQLRRAKTPSMLVKGGMTLGNGVHVDFYFGEGMESGGTNAPVVVWLPGFSVAGGYTCSELNGEPPYYSIAKEGFLVVTFDTIGCGTRIREAQSFYGRYPRWSLMGKMVQDISLVVDAARKIPFADGQRIYLVGYDLGGMAALYAAALDPGIAGVATAGGFAPMRVKKSFMETLYNNPAGKTADRGDSAIVRWTQNPLLMPRLGVFVGNEKRTPFDYNELMAMVAPRPQLAITFTSDSLSDHGAVMDSLGSTARVYALLDAKSDFYMELCDDYNHYTPELNRSIIKFLQGVSKLNKTAPEKNNLPQK